MQNNCNKSEMTCAGFWIRLAAHLIDMVIVFAGLLVIRFVLSGAMTVLKDSPLGGNILFQFSLKDIILYIAGASYYVLMTYYTGSTIGKRTMNLKVVTKDGERPGFIDVLYRETVGRFLCKITLGIGYIIVGFDPKKRGLHDLLCDTQVIFAKKVIVIHDERRIAAYRRKPELVVPIPEERISEKIVTESTSADTITESTPIEIIKEKIDNENNEGVHNE